MANCKPMASPLTKNEKFQLHDGAQQVDATTYRSLVGSLIYVTHTRLDIIFLVSLFPDL